MAAVVSQKVRKRLVWDFHESQTLLKYGGVSTVCEESRCPNRYECSSAGVATFMIGGSVCTRACRFCHIDTGRGPKLNTIAEKEKEQIIEAAQKAGYQYVVITAVARDDDEKALAEHFANITRALNALGIETELLIPDFHAKPELLDVIAESKPLVVAHNIETVKRLSPKIRPQAGYDRSMSVYRYFAEHTPDIILKSGFMTGLGETREEISELLKDLRKNHIEIVTAGQYLQPSAAQTEVVEVWLDEQFTALEKEIETLGFSGWEAGAFVRSSYMAGRTMQKVKERKRLSGFRIP